MGDELMKDLTGAVKGLHKRLLERSCDFSGNCKTIQGLRAYLARALEPATQDSLERAILLAIRENVCLLEAQADVTKTRREGRRIKVFDKTMCVVTWIPKASDVKQSLSHAMAEYASAALFCELKAPPEIVLSQRFAADRKFRFSCRIDCDDALVDCVGHGHWERL